MSPLWEKHFGVWALSLALCLSACTGEGGARQAAAALVRQGAFVAQRFDTSSFVLYGLLRAARADAPAVGQHVLHVYVEGDGYAWRGRRTPSRDPTPANSVALRMAQADPTSGPVLYLARPCQYVQGEEARLCATVHWTHGRLSAVVIQSLGEAVDMAKGRTGASRVVLVGHSGGGGAAALLASRRDDVDFLGSVGGVLNHKAWTAHHKVSPLRSSLNPADQAAALRPLPQRHWTGGSDAIVPEAVNADFCRQMAQQGDAVCATLPNMGHEGPWEKSWNYDYARPLRRQGGPQ